MSAESYSKFQNFLQVKTITDLVTALEQNERFFLKTIFGNSDGEKYKTFSVSKKSGGKRKILAPNMWLKHIQRSLNSILSDGYASKICVHGYSKNKSVISNAHIHLRKKYIVNIDLENFFPSINFGRVRGLFKSHPFNFSENIAVLLANICCYKGELPQGAPTSPTISNYICRNLDNELMNIAIHARCTYSRYADDITFSTNLRCIPDKIGEITGNSISISKTITDAIIKNGFNINNSKTRYATKNNRQEVTGIITNEKLNVNRKYVRQIRAMLHSWEKYGIDKAAEEHFFKHNHGTRLSSTSNIAFLKKLTGKIGFIGFVKGKSDLVYSGLVKRLKMLSPEIPLAIVLKEAEYSEVPIIYGEGKTDSKHLKMALNKLQENHLFSDLKVEFGEYSKEDTMNNDKLLKICESLHKVKIAKTKIICIFDRDDYNIVKKVSGDGSATIRSWGNNVYSIILPVPSHRSFKEISIEHYYLDSEIMTKDKNNRRLFLANEFDIKTGKHLNEELEYKQQYKLKRKYPFIIDSDVFDIDGDNIALPKNDFADYITNEEKPFNDFTFEHFEKLFHEIERIVNRKE